jgi:hypothetical protein
MAILTRLLALVILVAGAWAVLATLFTPPPHIGVARGDGRSSPALGESGHRPGAHVAGVAVAWLLVARLLGAHGSR